MTDSDTNEAQHPAHDLRPAGDQMLGVTGLAAHPQKPVLETAAFQVVLELAVHVIRQLSPLLRQMASERRVVFFDDPIEQGLLEPVTLVTTSVLVLVESPRPLPLPRARPQKSGSGYLGKVTH